jgi:hypothetical protein
VHLLVCFRQAGFFGSNLAERERMGSGAARRYCTGGGDSDDRGPAAAEQLIGCTAPVQEPAGDPLVVAVILLPLQGPDALPVSIRSSFPHHQEDRAVHFTPPLPIGVDFFHPSAFKPISPARPPFPFFNHFPPAFVRWLPAGLSRAVLPISHLLTPVPPPPTTASPQLLISHLFLNIVPRLVYSSCPATSILLSRHLASTSPSWPDKFYMLAMEDSKPQMSPEDASINYMFQVCLLAFMRNADQPNFHDSLSLFDSLAVRTSPESGRTL